MIKSCLCYETIYKYNFNIPFKGVFETMWLLLFCCCWCCTIDRLATTFLAVGELLILFSCCGPVVAVVDVADEIGVALPVGVVEFNGVCVWDCVAGAIRFSVMKEEKYLKS